MAAIAELTRLDASIERGTGRLLELQRPDGIWVGELVLLPPSSPVSIYNFACWARQTFVALAVAQSLRPVRAADVDLTAIGAIPGRTRPPHRPNRLRRRAVV